MLTSIHPITVTESTRSRSPQALPNPVFTPGHAAKRRTVSCAMVVEGRRRQIVLRNCVLNETCVNLGDNGRRI